MNHDRLLVRCCHLGMFVQALVVNVTPLLFIPLRDEFGLSFEQIGRLVLINFLTQMVVDLACSAWADRVPTKLLVVAANLLAAAGLWVFALAPGAAGGPAWFASPYDGLLAGTIIFSVGCGLLEVLLSPIVNAVPSDRKSGAMAVLHAFYPIGKVAVILVTGGLLYLTGAASWRAILLGWSIFPLVNTAGFLLVRIPALHPDDSPQTLRALFRAPSYRWLLAAIALAGATEVTVAQWTSAYVQNGLGFPKLVADLAGFALFGVGMIAGRLWFGLRGGPGDPAELRRIMLVGAALSTAAYLLMALAPWPALALVACASSGFFVSMLWPGSISLSAARFPLAGASMFACLAAAGDAGAALMPWGVGLIADATSLRAGLLVAALGPFLLLFVLRALRPEAAEPEPLPPPRANAALPPEARACQGPVMNIEERREGHVVILSIEGRLDHAGAEIFDARMSRLIQAGERALVIDFHGVDFVASMGLRSLIKPYQTLAPEGGRIVVTHLGDSVRTVFRLAGIDQAIPIYGSVDEAVAALT